MSSETVPFLLATLFTVGCIAIHKAEQHAEQVSEVLGGLFFAIAAFAVMAVVAHVSGASNVLANGFQEQLKLTDQVPATLE